MYVLFEEDGAFKVGVVLADNITSLQVELPSGKRVKVKAATVLLHFQEPSAADLLAQAEAEAEHLDVDFLWEACGEGEFAFRELAEEYFGHAPRPVEAASILVRLQSAPVYFHRKGKGRFRKAPPEILRAALAGLEKKRLQALAVKQMAEELQAHRLPGAFEPLTKQLLYKPDRNGVEAKALELASAWMGLAPAHVLQCCGAIPSTHDYHVGRFQFEHFPKGTGFPEYKRAVEPPDLASAQVRAFSIDDATTTEIDDAFSVASKPGGGWRIGIHIAAPGLGFEPGSELDSIARERLSTVYMPGRKITMLPEEVIERFTLKADCERAAISLYIDVAPDLRVCATQTRIERVPIIANLRHHDIEPLFNDVTLSQGGPDFSLKEELTLLWRVAEVLEAGRGKPSVTSVTKEYAFSIDWSEPEGRITISQRKRGSPLDKLVSELMIVSNGTWGKQLADAGIPAIYRAQSAGKVRMTTSALPHEGLGVDHYAWSSSPLRRYVDLVNQWQLIACLRNEAPPYAAHPEALLGAIRDFELAYLAYGEFQRQMEHYWCLRWLIQENYPQLDGIVVRDGLVRLEMIPLVLRIPSLPACDAGTRVRLEVESVDLLELSVRCRYVHTLQEIPETSLEIDEVPE